MIFSQRNRKFWIAGVLLLLCGGISLFTFTHISRKEKTQTDQTAENIIPESEAVRIIPAGEEASASNTAENDTPAVPDTEACYELVYQGVSVFRQLSHYAYQKEAFSADLYQRELLDDTGKYLELSLWSEEKELWHTIADDDLAHSPLFWQDASQNLTLKQGLCYYAVNLDGNTYLMEYSVESTSCMVTMSYKVFGVCAGDLPARNGSEALYDAGRLSLSLVADGHTDPAVSFPVKQMIAFADTLAEYMENGCLLASTLHGAFETASVAEEAHLAPAYLYDIFPWLPELSSQLGIHSEDFASTEAWLAALQELLPISDASVIPDAAANGSGFITGEYYTGSDQSFLSVRRKENGAYEGTLLIDNLLYLDFEGNYQDGILTAAEMTAPDEAPLYTLEIAFQNGKASVTITAVAEPSYVAVGDTFLLDRNRKPEDFTYLRNTQ